MASNKLVDFFRRMAHQEKLKKEVWNTVKDTSNITIEELDFRHSQKLINKAIEQLSPQRKKIFLMNKDQGLKRNWKTHLVPHLQYLCLLFKQCHIRDSSSVYI
jgi:RNA polymerase sigma-70 factor (ECF subfamily)